jgi:hypothetical protein
MSLNARRVVYAATIVVFMFVLGWEVVYDGWRAVFGDHPGSPMEGFWDHIPVLGDRFGANGTAGREVDFSRIAATAQGNTAEHEPAGEAMARFWDLQVETWVNALLFVFILDFVYRMHRGADGGWEFAPVSTKVRAGVYAGLVLLMLVCSAEGPLRNVLEVPLPNDIAASVARYFRRALEGVLAVIGLMIFMDFVRPGRLSEARPGKRPSLPVSPG